VNFPFEMKPDRSAVAVGRAARRGESFFRAFETGFDFPAPRFVFIRHLVSPGE
jgi:hypothetical protein